MAKREEERRTWAAALTPPFSDVSVAPPLRAPDDRFVPGSVFAGRYRIVARIGEGDTGEVWRADDLVLQTPVALKLVHSHRGDDRERLLNEVRLARGITHPSVCRVYDVGEAEGQAFYSMEFVEGEDLATLIRRAGRLPQERVLEIARQLCDGVAAAHANGVLHLDLKPANVLVDESGSVRITDFGIATARIAGTADTLTGTPGYRAPEQRTPGARLSECTDVYAIGLILYELVVGQRPFADEPAGAAAMPGRPSLLVNEVNGRLERIILKALSPAPADRPASAAAMLAELPATATAPNRRPLLSWALGAAIGVAAVLVALLRPATRAPSAVLTDQDTIVLADFVNATGDRVFDGTLKVATAVALEQSPFLKIFPDDALRETLRLMERRPDEPITRALARDIARRERLKALVAGSISPLGTHYALALEAINAETGDIMAREQVEASGKEQVLTLLGRAAATLRERLGESLPSIRKYDVPLARATTPSLEALHAYSLALDDGRVFLRVEAIPHLQRAIELDPDFALAHALLSGVYANTGQSSEAPPHSRRAFELRDRVSERERYFISWRYYLDATRAWDKALDLASSWTVSYPREAFAFNSLGLALATFGEHRKAVDAFQQASRIDPKFIPPRRNLAQSLIALNRFDEAKAALDEATRAGMGSLGIGQLKYQVALTAGDTETLAELAGQARTVEERMWLLNSQARAASYGGRVKDAHALFQQAVQLALGERVPELAGLWLLEDAEMHAVAGQCTEARREASAGLALSRDNVPIEHAARALAMCGEPDEAEKLAGELAATFPEATLTARVQIPIIHAAVALARGDAARVREVLGPVRPYDHATTAEFWPSFLRAEAHLRLREAEAATFEYNRILTHRGDAPASPLHPLAQLGLARASALQGNVGDAREQYGAFLRLWRDADRDLTALRAAEQERARLPQ